MGAGEPEHVQNYFKQFFVIYSDLKNYQRKLMDGVMKMASFRPLQASILWQIQNAMAMAVSNATQIVNYPVQGYGNDLVQWHVCEPIDVSKS